MLSSACSDSLTPPNCCLTTSIAAASDRASCLFLPCVLFPPSMFFFFFFSSRRRHTRSDRDWSSEVCSSDLCAADALVLPSSSEETWGLVVNEATACGVPSIVSHAVGCAPDLIEEGRTGYIYPFGDIDARSEERRVGKEGRSRWSTYH